MFNDEIYFKNKDTFFELRKIKNIYFSKSGVITTGIYRITKVKTNNEKDFYKYLLLGEENINNKISDVIKKHKKLNLKKELKKVKQYKYITARGISYNYEDKDILIGNEYFFKENNIEIESAEELGTIIYVSVNRELLGYLVISDGIKKSVKKNIDKLDSFGIRKKYLLSGDNYRIVNLIAKEVGINDCYSNSNIYEKGFWYIYNSKNNKGKNMYVRNNEFDKDTIISDINVSFNNVIDDFNKTDIYIKRDIYSVVKMIKYIKDFIGFIWKNLLILIIHILIDILLISIGINYYSVLLILNTIVYIYLYNKYLKIK